MRILAVLPLLIALTGIIFAEDNKPPAGFTALFNGKDLTGWWGCGTEDPRAYLAMYPAELAKKRAASLVDLQMHWFAVNGELVNDGKGLYLTTDKNFGNFELSLEYTTVPKADNGIYLRGIPQVQIWDSTDVSKFKFGAQKGSGGLWNNSPGAPGKDPLVLADKPIGQWNKIHIMMVGENVTVRLNDELVVDNAKLENHFDRKSPVPKAGPIPLQTNGGEIWWRNIFITYLRHPITNAVTEGLNSKIQAIKSNARGFRSFFNYRTRILFSCGKFNLYPL